MEGSFARVPKRWVPNVMGQTGSLDQISVNLESFTQQRRSLIETIANATTDLGDFDRMSQARSVKIVFPTEENLRLALESSKGRCVDNSVSIYLKTGPIFPFALRQKSVNTSKIKGLVEGVVHLARTKP